MLFMSKLPLFRKQSETLYTLLRHPENHITILPQSLNYTINLSIGCSSILLVILEAGTSKIPVFRTLVSGTEKDVSMIRDIWNRTRDGKDSGSFRVLNIEVAGIGPAREITRQDVFNQNIKSLDHTVEILKRFFHSIPGMSPMTVGRKTAICSRVITPDL